MNNSNSSLNIHERLYLEKDKYFEMKKLEINTKLENEIKQCTFSPKLSAEGRNKDRRSFDKIYSDILEF